MQELKKKKNIWDVWWAQHLRSKGQLDPPTLTAARQNI